MTHKDEELDDDAGVVDMVGAEDEEEEEEDDGVRIGAPIETDDAPFAAAEGDASAQADVQLQAEGWGGGRCRGGAQA